MMQPPNDVCPLMKYLLGQVGVHEFLTHYWATHPLYIPGETKKFQQLLSIKKLSDHLAGALSDNRTRVNPDLRQKPIKVRASYDRGLTHIDSSPADAMAHYDRGATLCVEGLDAYDDQLAGLASSARREMNFLGTTDVRVYLSPDKQGFENHFDARVATTLQIEGQKRWKYSNEVAVNWPNFQMPVGFDPARLRRPEEAGRPPEECTFCEVTLSPGDVLCLPAGCWHSAEAIGHSLALNLTFSGFGSFWGPALMSVLSTSSVLRAPAPPVIMGDGLPGGVPGSIERFLDMGITELIDAFAALKENSEPL